MIVTTYTKFVLIIALCSFSALALAMENKADKKSPNYTIQLTKIVNQNSKVKPKNIS